MEFVGRIWISKDRVGRSGIVCSGKRCLEVRMGLSENYVSTGYYLASSSYKTSCLNFVKWNTHYIAKPCVNEVQADSVFIPDDSSWQIIVTKIPSPDFANPDSPYELHVSHQSHNTGLKTKRLYIGKTDIYGVPVINTQGFM